MPPMEVATKEVSHTKAHVMGACGIPMTCKTNEKLELSKSFGPALFPWSTADQPALKPTQHEPPKLLVLWAQLTYTLLS